MSRYEKLIEELGEAFCEFTDNNHYWLDQATVDFMCSEKGLDFVRTIALEASSNDLAKSSDFYKWFDDFIGTPRAMVAYCRDCGTYGIPKGKDKICGNCGKTNLRLYREL
jgi:hypothetical protein